MATVDLQLVRVFLSVKVKQIMLVIYSVFYTLRYTTYRLLLYDGASTPDRSRIQTSA